MFDGSKVLIAGGAGFIGTNLAHRLLSVSNCDIVSTFYKTKPRVFDRRIKHTKCDLRNSKDCDRVIEGVDYIFMCAANTSGAAVIHKAPLCHVTPNVIMNATLLDSAYKAKVKKFLFISSSVVYPVVDHPVKEDDVCGEMFDKYFCAGWMKIFTEKMCEMYSCKVNPPMQTVVVRPGNIYGEFDDFEWETSHVLPSLIRKVMERHNPINVWGDGQDVRDFIYIQDFLDGMLAAMKYMTEFYPVNISSGQTYSIKEVLEIILSIDGYDNAVIEFDDSKPTMIPKRSISSERAKTYLGFNPQTTMHKGLSNTVRWYRENR